MRKLAILALLSVSLGVVANASVLSEDTLDPRIASTRNVNNLLAQANLERLVVENKTPAPVVLETLEFYHENFEGDIPVVPIFDPCREILSDAREDESLGFSGASVSNVFIKPYVEKSEKTATILRRRVTVGAGTALPVRANESAYVGRVIPKTPGVFLGLAVTDDGKVKFVLTDAPAPSIDARVYATNLERAALANKLSLPFLSRLSSAVFPAHGFTPEEFFKKMELARQAGLRTLERERAEPSIRLKIPKITHTLLTKRGEKPFDASRKRWFLKTIKTLPVSDGWKHFVWTRDTLTPTDLEELSDSVEVKSIGGSGLAGLAEIERLMGEGYYHHASALARYSILSKFGGAFRGTDLEITRDITPFNAAFAFYAGVDVNTARMLGSGFLAARANHPVINGALELALAHIGTNPSYLADPRDKLGCHYINYGNGVLSVAFQKYGKIGEDMVFGSRVFSPPRPSRDVSSFDDVRFALGVDTHAVHYSEGEWRK